MQSNRFLLLPNAVQNIMNGTIDLDTNPMYAVALHADLVPTMAMVQYGDFAPAYSGNVEGATQANPVVITSTAHGRATNDRVTFSGVGGMIELNGNTYNITVIDANTYSLQSTVDGADIDGTAFTAFTTGGTWARDYLGVALSAQAIITNGQYRAFDCADVVFGLNVALTAKLYAIFVGNVAARTVNDLCIGYELLNPVSGVITGVSATNPATVTSNAHPLALNDAVLIQGVDMPDVTTLNSQIFNVANPLANTFDLSGIDLSAATLPGRTGAWTKLNSSQVAQSVNSNFTIQFQPTGLFAF